MVAGIALASCSSDEGDGAEGCTVDSECKGNRICDDGACVDPSGNDAGGSGSDPGGNDAGSGPDLGGNDAGGSGATSLMPKEGDVCQLTGSNCDPDCVNSCGSPECVDLCCSDSSGTGVSCDGTCVSPKCDPSASTENWPAADRDRPWVCFQGKTDGASCECTNSQTASELTAEGYTIVSGCSDDFCAFQLSEHDFSCLCAESGSDFSFGDGCTDTFDYCSGVVLSCDMAPVIKCESPCDPVIFE